MLEEKKFPFSIGLLSQSQVSKAAAKCHHVNQSLTDEKVSGEHSGRNIAKLHFCTFAHDNRGIYDETASSFHYKEETSLCMDYGKLIEKTERINRWHGCVGINIFSLPRAWSLVMGLGQCITALWNSIRFYGCCIPSWKYVTTNVARDISSLSG